MPLLDKIALLLSHREHLKRHGPDTEPEEASLANCVMGHSPHQQLDLVVKAQPSACPHITGPFRAMAGQVTKAGEKGLYSSHIIALALEKEEAGVWL